MSQLYLAAAHRSSGKTTVAIGLCRALRARGLVIAPFKKGPDYIDPLWLGQAAGRPCFNLDFNTMAPEPIKAALGRESMGTDLALIEGNVGLFDSTDLAGANSNAELAKLVGAPVVLVLDCQGMSRGIAPLLLGYRAFDPSLCIGGVILNKVGGQRHGQNLIRAVQHYTDIPVLGLLERDSGLAIAERHLGLMPSNESTESDEWIERIAALVAAGLDLDGILALAEQATVPPMEQSSPSRTAAPRDAAPVRIGVAQDAAFGFYYPDDLRALAAGGAELVSFSPVSDSALPAVDGLFIGGGFPECRMAELEANQGMRRDIAAFVARGGPVYAECGGLMYLCKGLTWGGQRREMVGVLDAEVEMHERPQGRGYVQLRETPDFPWPAIPPGATGQEISAHEFHHSAIVDAPADWTYAYEVLRGSGISGGYDGVVQGGLLACYAHLRDVNAGWTARFLAQVRRCRRPG